MATGRLLSSFRAGLLARLWTAALRLQLATWHKEVHGLARLDHLIARRIPVLAVFWHGKYTPLFALLQGRRAVVFTSASFRGSVIAGICRLCGYRPVQIPDHGRERSLEIMRGALRGATLCGIAVDGPLGPYHAVKPGPVRLASELGLLVVPITFAARRSRVATGRWDRMDAPRLFTRVVFLLGEPEAVPGGLDEEGIARWAERIGRRLDALDAEAEARVRGGRPEG